MTMFRCPSLNIKRPKRREEERGREAMIRHHSCSSGEGVCEVLSWSNGSDDKLNRKILVGMCSGFIFERY
jgi:hypothetical protein